MLQRKVLTKKRIDWSKIGLGLSFACAVHCVVSPLFIAFLPVVSAELFHNPAIEIILLGSSFLLIGITNLIGFIKHHKQFAPMVYMFLGFSLILSGHLTHNHGVEFGGALVGGLFLAYSIYLNNQAKKQKPTCESNTCCKK